ncbi:MAG: amidohydrolase family protein [Promethearchaeota archaeon]
MEKLVIKSGLIYDPINSIEGEIKDILIENGKIVEKFSNIKDVKEIDANGKTVIPSAIDIHTHVASQQVNWARLLGMNNRNFMETWKGLTLRNIAIDYISNGYTFILEANVFPSLAKQTLFNFNQIPVIDKGMLLNVSNLWALELEFQRAKIEDMSIFLSDLLSKTYGFGFKVYNPFESESWNFKELREDITSSGRLFNFNALDVYENVTKSVEYLGLPHSVHAHIEGYENDTGQKNLFTILEKIKNSNLKPNPKTNLDIKREQVFHIAHANAYSQDGNNEKLINFLNKNQAFDIDLGFIGFNKINPLITSDRRLINSMLNLNVLKNPHKLISSAIESEGDSFVSIRNFQKEEYHDCVLWANALELALNIKNKFQISLSLNYPNYSNINNIPEISTWLVSENARTNFMKDMNKEFLKSNSLQDHNKFLSFSEYVILSRANPAKSLGLGSIKGNLGEGADADINILDINIKDLDLEKEYQALKNALSNIEYVIKAGEIVKKQEKIDLGSHGSIFWTEGKVDKKEDKELILSKKEEFYKKYGSIFYDSFGISIKSKYLRKIN